ncbi:hypothetical protein ACU4GI_19750 [Cupriavidus basilensis]
MLIYRAPLPSTEAWPVVWVWSALLTLRQKARRRRNIAAAIEALQQLRARLAGAKTRLRGAAEIDLQFKVIVEKYHVGRYLKVRPTVREEHQSVQADAAGSPRTRELMTSDRSLSPTQVLEAHKGEP